MDLPRRDSSIPLLGLIALGVAGMAVASDLMRAPKARPATQGYACSHRRYATRRLPIGQQ